MRHNQWNLSSKIVSSMEIWHMSICPCKQINNKWNLSSKTVSSMEIWHTCTCPCKQETTNGTCNQSQSVSPMKIWLICMCPSWDEKKVELVLKYFQLHENLTHGYVSMWIWETINGTCPQRLPGPWEIQSGNKVFLNPKEEKEHLHRDERNLGHNLSCKREMGVVIWVSKDDDHTGSESQIATYFDFLAISTPGTWTNY